MWKIGQELVCIRQLLPCNSITAIMSKAPQIGERVHYDGISEGRENFIYLEEYNIMVGKFRSAYRRECFRAVDELNTEYTEELLNKITAPKEIKELELQEL